MKKQNKKWTDWLYWFSFAVVLIFVYKTLDNFTEILNWLNRLFQILMPFVVGILVAYLLYIPCRKVENVFQKTKNRFIRRKARTLSVILVYIIVAILLVIAVRFVLPTIAQSFNDLISNAGNYVNSTIENIKNAPEDSLIKQIDTSKLTQIFQDINLKEFLNVEKITEYAKGAIGVANGIFDFFVALIVSIYILIERREILRFIKKFAAVIVNEKVCTSIGRYFKNANEIFFRFLSSQILDAIIVGIITSIAMLVMDVKYAILLGVLIGIANLIPYFGAIIGVGITILITILTGGFGKAIWVAIIIIILQQIDANIINPKIVGNSLKISPLLVIFAVTIGGAYFGILGMFIAVPVCTVVKMGIEEWIDYQNIKRKQKEI